MKNKIISIIFLSFLLIPNLVFASWWNPFSWKIFNKTSSTNAIVTTNTEDELVPDTEAQSLTSIKFDNAVIKSSLMIKIFDNDQYISQGSGISLGGLGNILTNYHVAEKVLLDPNRYKAYGCVTISLDTVPECNYLLSPTRKLLSGSISKTQYNKDLDLALLYVDQVKVNGKWVSIVDTSLNSLKDRSINLSSYTKKYTDLSVGSPVYSVGYPDYGDEKTIQVDGIVEEILKDPNSGQVLILSALNISHGNSGGPVFNSKGELVGVTVACLTASPDSDKCKQNSGLFIPLPSVNWWYTQANNYHVITWEGKNYYSSNNGISDDTQKATLCSLENNMHYDSKISTNSCTCNTGYTKNTANECVDNSGIADVPKTPYGQQRDPEAEKKALQMLDGLFSQINGGSSATLPTSPMPSRDQVESYIYDNYTPAVSNSSEGAQYKAQGLNYASKRKSANDSYAINAERSFNSSVKSYTDAINSLGNNPPTGWEKSHNCLVSAFSNARSASQYLLLSLSYSGSSQSLDYIATAQTFDNKAKQYAACALNTRPAIPQ